MSYRNNDGDGSDRVHNGRNDEKVSREEILEQIFGEVGSYVNDFSCAVESTVLLHGRMYVTSKYLCFYSNLFGLEKKIRIPYSHVNSINKENTALVIPNAIAITTFRKEYIFRSFWDRDECFKMLKGFVIKNETKRRTMSNAEKDNEDFSVKLPSKNKARSTSTSTEGDSSIEKGSPLRKESTSDSIKEEEESGDKGEKSEHDGEEQDEVLEEGDDDEDNFHTAPGEHEVEDVQNEAAKQKLKIAVVTDTLPITVQDFADLFVEDSSEHSWLKFHELEKDRELKCEKWRTWKVPKGSKQENAYLTKTRDLKFFKPVNLPGLAETRGRKIQKYIRFHEEGLIVCSSTHLEDVPAADCFSVEDVISVKKAYKEGENPKIDVQISFEVKFVKSTMMKYFIESNTETQVTKEKHRFYDYLLKYAQELASTRKKVETEVKKEEVAAPVVAVVKKEKPSSGRGVFGSIFASVEESLNTWKNVPGRLVFIACFVLMMLVMTQVYWNVKVVNNRLVKMTSLVEDLQAKIDIIEARTRKKKV
jgi:hypothetical protein